MESLFAALNGSLYWKFGICTLIVILTCAEIWAFSGTCASRAGAGSGANGHRGGGKLLYIAALNVSGALGVILLHANGVFWSRPQGTLWLSANFIETFFYWPVPVFFMITGATLIGYLKRYDTKAYFRKRSVRTLLPFVFWSLFACGFNVLYLGQPMDWNVLHIVSNIFSASYLTIYWFFLSLFSIYLSIPLLALLADKERAFRYVIIAGIVANLSLPLLCKILNFSFNVRLEAAGGLLIYAMTGYYLSRIQFSSGQRLVIYICGISGWLVHYLGTMVSSAGQPSISMVFKGYDNLPAFLQAVAVFVLFRYLFEKHQVPGAVRSLIFRFSTLTFGVYLIHWYFLVVLQRELSLDSSTLWWRICGAVFVFILSSHIVMLIKKIPLLRKAVP